MLIAVPGWPLPTFWTASMASTRTVSIARRSSSPKPSGRVGCGWAGLPVGASVAASAGASGPVLCVMWCGAPSGRSGVGQLDRSCVPGVACRHSGRDACGPGHPSSSTSALPAARPQHQRRSTLVIRAQRRAGGRTGAGLQWLRFPSPVRKRLGALLPARRRARRAPGDGAVRASTESARAPAGAPPCGRRLGAYVALTKPRIIELLLVTTRAGDDAGRPGLAVVAAAARHAGRRHARGRRGQRLQLLRTTATSTS